MENYLVYVMDTEAFRDDRIFDGCVNIVSEYRRNKVLRLRRRQDKEASLAAGCVLAAALRRYADIDERQITYVKNKSGKPYIVENYDEQYRLGNADSYADVDLMCASAYRNVSTDIHFSLSHTEGCVAVILGPSECGIDVERTRLIPDSIIRRLFSQNDIDKMSLLDEKTNARDIYSTCVWTRREAYGKMMGTGLSMSDVSQKMVMDDEYMCRNKVWIANNNVCKGESGHLELMNIDTSGILSLSLKSDYITAVSVDEKAKGHLDVSIVDSCSIAENLLSLYT